MTKKHKPGSGGIPLWLTITADLIFLGLLIFNVIQHPEAVSTTMVLGGLIGGIHGTDKFLRSRDEDGG